MSALITAQDVTVTARAPGGKRMTIIHDVSLSLQAGETLGIVGESGSGKTTLIRALLGLQPRSAGEVTFAGGNLRRETAMIFQDPVSSLSPRIRIGALITEPFIIHGEPIADRKAKAAELLATVGLPAEFADRFPHELSGGQARRAGVARALALKPRLVVADEPTAGLDVSVQGEILNLMADLKQQFGLSYIIVTHNLAMIRHVSDRLAIMYLGRLVEEGPTADVFANPSHPYTKSLIDSEPIPDPRQRRHGAPLAGETPSILARPWGCEFHPRCPMAQSRCTTEAPLLTEAGNGRRLRCHYPLPQGE